MVYLRISFVETGSTRESFECTGISDLLPQTIVFFDQVEPCGEQQMVDEMVTGFRIQYNTNVS